MGQRLDRFFAGTSKPLRLAFIGFVVGLLGDLTALTIDHTRRDPVASVAVGIGVVGWVVAVAAILYGSYTIRRSSDRDVRHSNRRLR